MSIVTEQGLDALSIRKTAEKLGSSQAPVYSCFSSKDELEQTLRLEIKSMLMSNYTSKHYTESYALNMAIGFVLFARDYSQLFRSLFLKRSDFKIIYQEFSQSHIAGMEKDKRFYHLTRARAQDTVEPAMDIYLRLCNPGQCRVSGKK